MAGLAPLIAVPVVLAALAAGGAYAYDASHEDLMARGVTVAGVDVGGMRLESTRVAIDQQVAEPLREPIRVRSGSRTYSLSARRARLRADVDAMARDALAASRSGNFVSRSWRDATGASESASVEPRVRYSKRAVSKLVDRVVRGTNRPARNATVSFASGSLERVKARTGRQVRQRKLERSLRSRIVRPGRRTLRASAQVTKPKVLTSEVEKRYPHYVVVNRGAFRLTYYRNLKKVRSYTIAVGKAGLETPEGTYNIQNKAENPAWHVPQSDWAGDLAGKVIPGGRSDNPLKARWMGIYDGAGIHGTNETGSLGTNASHGCIRMAIPEVIELYSKVPVSTPVYIG